MANKILIATEINDRALARSVQETLSDIPNATLTQWQGAMGEKGALSIKTVPDIIILDDDPSLGHLTVRIAALKRFFPKSVIFAISADQHPEAIVEAMKAGAANYLVAPIKHGQLVGAVEDVRATLANAGKLAKGSVFSFISSKGGLGSTVIAVNTAVALATKKHGASALFDMSFQSGDSSVLLDVVPEASMADICRNFHRLDASFLKAAMVRHDSGLELLAAPFRPERCEEIEANHVAKILDLMKKLYDTVIVDCTSMFINDCAFESFKASERTVIITDLSVPAIRNAARLAKLIYELGIDQDKVEFVINRFVKGSTLSIEEAEKSLQKRIYWLFPNDFHDIVTSINKGIPLVQLLPHAPFSENVTQFSDRLLSPEINAHYRGIRGTFGKAI